MGLIRLMNLIGKMTWMEIDWRDDMDGSFMFKVNGYTFMFIQPLLASALPTALALVLASVLASLSVLESALAKC